jgi:lysophospholipase L1-like esterase
VYARDVGRGGVVGALRSLPSGVGRAVGGLILLGVVLLAAGWASEAGAASSGANRVVTVRYQGSYDGTITYNQASLGTVVSHITWDLQWTGTLRQLLAPTTKVLTVATLTGTATVNQASMNCTVTLSAGPSTGNAPPTGQVLDAYRDSADTSKVVIGVHAPLGVGDTISSDQSCAGGGAEGAGATTPQQIELEVPTPQFDLTIRGSQSQRFDGNWGESDSISTSTSKISSIVTFSGSASNYVALGDSFSAGQVAPFVPRGQNCFRSVYAYPEVYDPDASFWACSGATISAVRDTQLAKLQRTTKLVTITIGGNDIGLFGELVKCLGPVKLAPCQVSRPNYAQLRIRLSDLYSNIHTRSPLARIFVLGYPNPLPATMPSPRCPGLKVLDATAFRLDARDVPALHNLVTRLDATIRLAVADSRVATYVSTEGPFVGHEICSFSDWFLPVSISESALSFHPDRAGHAELARLLRAAAGPPSS